MDQERIASIRRNVGALLGLALAMCMGSAGAQVYKWQDAKGIIHYSDTPPPASHKKLEVKNFGAAHSAPELPYRLALAARSSPVMLYATKQCAPCEQGRTLLQARGIPYLERTVTTIDDQQQLKQAGSDGELPLLLVGSNKLVGFDAAAWNAALTSAAYPAERMLPPGYQYPPAEAAAPPGPSAARASAAPVPSAAARAAQRQKLPAVNVPPDFQF
jgi:hypothetical protein